MAATPRIPAVAALALGAAILVPSPAIGFSGAGGPAVRALDPPLELPSPASARTAAAARWIVAGRPGHRTRELARSAGAREIVPGRGVYSVPIRRARALAAALERSGALWFAEPDAALTRTAFPSDPLTSRQHYIRRLIPPELDPPPVTAASPALAVLDTGVDATHFELDGPNVRVLNAPLAREFHGTAVAGVAAAEANGEGIVGVWPGMRIISATNSGSCTDSVAQIDQAVRAGASVLNMSYGFIGNARGDLPCFAHQVATQRAFRRGVMPVAAAGNEFQAGNLPSRPAVDPHVMSVAANNPDDTSAGFSSANLAVDVSAPGVDILTTVPRSIDPDGDGFGVFDGTSFSAPMVAAIASWIRARRPDLDPHQVSQLLQETAIDLGRPGYDFDFGFGLANLPGALAARTPPRDPQEPNEDAIYVNGRAFGRPNAVIFSGRRTTRLRAQLDRIDDPSDTYRITVPGRSAVRVTARPRRGDPDLDIYGGGVPTIFSNAGLLDRSARAGGGSEAVSFRNRSRRSRTLLVNVYVSRVQGSVVDYDLTLARRR